MLISDLFKKKPLIFGFKCILIAAICLVLNYLFKNDVGSYTRVMLSELYSEENIDVLFVGASHTYRSFDTDLIEKETGLNCFNAGSSSQQLQGSYYLIKEANEKCGVKRVLLDVTFSMQQLESPGAVQTYILTDYMHDGANKKKYLWESFGVDGLINDFFPLLHGISLTPKTAVAHLTGEYRNNSYKYLSFDDEEYRGQGFVYNYNIYQGNDYEPEVTLEGQLFSDFSAKYLFDIIEYCKTNSIQLILCEPPMPDGLLSRENGFQTYVDEVRKIAGENEIGYWEFNLAKPDFLHLEKDCFCDNNHLNGHGAELFSHSVARLLMAEETVNCFFDSYAEKMENNPDGTFFE